MKRRESKATVFGKSMAATASPEGLRCAGAGNENSRTFARLFLD